MKPKETIYKDYRFRSRLEARYAVFFDALGVRFEYENDDCVLPNGVRYLPDFWLPEQDCWIEIKGQYPTRAEEAKARLLAVTTWKRVYIFFGDIWIPGTPESYYTYFDEDDKYNPKGAFTYDPSELSIYGENPTSPCVDSRKCPHIRCPNHMDIELGEGYDHLIKALYEAEFSPMSDGDSCKLCRTAQGDLIYLVPNYRLLPQDAPPPKKVTYVAVPLPQSIKECEKELKQLLFSKPANWVWRAGNIGDLYGGGSARWYECDTCGKLCIAISGECKYMACYAQHKNDPDLYQEGEGWLGFPPKGSDETPRLIEAYRAARQARFEHGEQGAPRPKSFYGYSSER